MKVRIKNKLLRVQYGMRPNQVGTYDMSVSPSFKDAVTPVKSLENERKED